MASLRFDESELPLPDGVLIGESFSIESESFCVYLVDTSERVISAVKILLSSRQIAVDMEGVNLSRQGPISLIQISPVESKTVFLFDISVLKSQAFNFGLFELLTSSRVLKVFFDVRGDCDALYHQYHFTPSPIVDCQVALMRTPRRRKSKYVIGLKKAFAFSETLSVSIKEALERVKIDGLSLFAEECGGNSSIWEQRPLPHQLLVYSSVDVWYLNAIFKEYFAESRISMDSLVQTTHKRILRVLSSEEELKGPQMAHRDFE